MFIYIGNSDGGSGEQTRGSRETRLARQKNRGSQSANNFFFILFRYWTTKTLAWFHLSTLLLLLLLLITHCITKPLEANIATHTSLSQSSQSLSLFEKVFWTRAVSRIFFRGWGGYKGIFLEEGGYKKTFKKYQKFVYIHFCYVFMSRTSIGGGGFQSSFLKLKWFFIVSL